MRIKLKTIQKLCSIGKMRRSRVGSVGIKFATNPVKSASDLVLFSGKASQKILNKSEILAQYASKNGLVAEEVSAQFAEAEKYLDEVSLERLLKLTNEGKLKLYDGIKSKKLIFEDFDDGFCSKESDTLFKYLFDKKAPIEEKSLLLKKLLALESEGKCSARNVLDIVKARNEALSLKDCNAIIDAVKSGELNPKYIESAINLEGNYTISLCKLYNAKSLNELSNSELEQLREILQISGAKHNINAANDLICSVDLPLLPKSIARRNNLVKQINQIFASGKKVKVNNVSKETANKFIYNFESTSKVFENAQVSIKELEKAGGINLTYSRDAFKQNIYKQIEHLSLDEQNKVLGKFGLSKISDSGSLSGLPVYLNETAGLSQSEIAINNEIKRFLTENKIVLPKGFEEYQAPLEEICKTFPEFTYTIGMRQHDGKLLAEHMLRVMQENTRNPLYQTLNSSDKKILGISSLLHDIYKPELFKDALHPLKSSFAVKSMLERMPNLTPGEKNRIINFVENHHFLEKIGTENPELIDDLAYTFRAGNDFKLAKIFAESDLKAEGILNKYGSKISGETMDAVENRILDIHSRGRLIFNKDITLDKAIQAGAKKVTLGEGELATTNWVVDAKQLGLDSESVIVHAPGEFSDYLYAQSGFGYGNNGVFSCRAVRNGFSQGYKNRMEFCGFRHIDPSDICFSKGGNGGTGFGKDYDAAKRLFLNSNEHNTFNIKVKENYFNLTGKQLSDKDYALIYKEASYFDVPQQIHSNSAIQKILGGEENALKFEQAVINENDALARASNCELVAQDLELGWVGTRRTDPANIDYLWRKELQDNNVLIIRFD